MAFALDPRLQADTLFVKSLAVSDLLIMNDARYPWAILVPRVDGSRELHDLDEATRGRLWQEILAVGQAVAAWPEVSKVNTGALGNVVAQLHIHVVGRTPSDPAWPGPVWGHSPRIAYHPDGAEKFRDFLMRSVVV